MDLVTELSDFLVTEHPFAAATALARHPVVQVTALLSELPPDRAAAVVRHAQVMRAVEYLQGVESSVGIIESMSTDDAARILRAADRQTANRLLEPVRSSHARSIRAKINFEADTIGGLTEPTVMLPATATLEEARSTAARDGSPYVYIVDQQSRLVGVVKSSDLGGKPSDHTLSSVMSSPVICLNHQTPLRSAVGHPAWAEYDILPVVDTRNELVGVIRHKILRQHIDKKSDWLPLHSAISTLLDLAGLYWSTGAALMLGSTMRQSRGTSSRE